MDFAAIGKNIRKYRKEIGMTQEELAEKAGLSTNYIGGVERGEKTPSLESFISIVNVLGVGADLILCDVIDCGYQVKASVLSDKIAKASPAKRESIFEVVEIMLRDSI